MSIEEAFHQICREAVPAKSQYVSLYCESPFYGGPEEGGWWGSDTNLIASQCFDTAEAAEAAKEAVEELAKEMSAQAKQAFYQSCADQLAAAEARGIDPDSLPEVDGEDRYFVVVEEVSGSLTHSDDRHWS